MLFTAFIFIAVKGTCQVVISVSPRVRELINEPNGLPKNDSLFNGDGLRELGVYIYPYQDVKLTISIDEPGDKIFITDTSQHILYTQTAVKGYFDYTTKKERETLVIYDRLGKGHYAIADVIASYDRNPILVFGSGAAKIEIGTTLLPMKMDTADKHFVRFLQLNPKWPDVAHFSISLGKIPPVNIRTDPEILHQLEEHNIITDVSTYQAVKDFINKNLNYLQTDTIGLNYKAMQGTYKIVIDYRKSYYLKYDKANGFFAELIAYATKTKMDSRVIDLIIHRE